MQKLNAFEEGIGEIGAAEVQVRSAIGEKTPLVLGEKRDQRPRRQNRVSGKTRLDAVRRQKLGLMRDVRRPDAPREPRLDSRDRQPGGLVRARAAGKHADRGARIGADRDRPLRPDDDIGHHVADDQNTRHRGLQSGSRASAAAIFAPSAALFLMRAMFGPSVRPPLAA